MLLPKILPGSPDPYLQRMSTRSQSALARLAHINALVDSINTLSLGLDQYVEVSITSAQILNMLANPITVLPALPVGQYYVGNLYFEYTFVTTGYVGGATTVLQLKSGSVAVSSGGFRPSLYMTDIIIGTTFTAQKEGDPIILAPSSANSTTGDGTLKVKLWYQIKTFG